MKTTLKIALDSYLRKDKTQSIIIRLVYKRKFAKFPTDFHILKKDWDTKNEKIKKTCKKYQNIDRVNAKIFAHKNELYDKVFAIVRQGLNVQDVSQFKDLVLNRPKKITFWTYTEMLEKEFMKMGRLGNASIYMQARKFIFRQNGYRDVLFSEITYSFLRNVEMMHLAAGYGLNSLSVVLRTVRAIYNRAIKEGYAKREQYPFAEYRIRQEKTKKRAIPKETITLIEEHNLEPGTMRRFAKDMFLFSFYTRGMNVSDIARLKVSSIVNNRIEYKRQKTGGYFSIDITEKAKAILDDYVGQKKANDYIFPIIKRNTPELIRKDVYNGTRNVNKNMQKIAKELGIKEHITTYVTRHSWATIGKQKGVSIATISQSMGHSDLKTTQIYLDDMDNSVLDEASRFITE